jgi:tetratricopeptide (TPR) repeat protein
MNRGKSIILIIGIFLSYSMATAQDDIAAEVSANIARAGLSQSGTALSDYYLLKGELEYYYEHHKIALSYAEKAIQLNDMNKEAIILSGDIQHSIGKSKKALKQYNMALKKGLADEELLNKIGLANLEYENYLDAIDNFTKVIELNPDNARYYAARGKSKLKLKMFGAAVEDFKQALSIDPGLQEAYKNLGFCYTNVGNYSKAFENLNKAIALNSNDEDAYYFRGLAFVKAFNNTKACEDFTKAAELGSEPAKKEKKTICK